MDEKLGIRFRKMQNYSYFAFWFETGSKNLLMQASTESELCIPSED